VAASGKKIEPMIEGSGRGRDAKNRMISAKGIAILDKAAKQKLHVDFVSLPFVAPRS
jgi:hypothetical protein